MDLIKFLDDNASIQELLKSKKSHCIEAYLDAMNAINFVIMGAVAYLTDTSFYLSIVLLIFLCFVYIFLHL